MQCVENETMSSGATPNEFEQNKVRYLNYIRIICDWI